MRPIVALTVVLLISGPGVATATSGVPDPGAAGPYAIGHTSFFLVDTTRNADSGFGGRPIPVSVWYPVDPSLPTSNAPQAIYALDPIYNSHWPPSTSADWEQFGMAPAYENVEVSVHRPFPLVLVSHGWGGRYYGLFFYAERLASHGFVVAVAQHFHDGGYAWETWDPLDAALLNRPRDLSFMLDAVLSRNLDVSSVLFNSVRLDQVAASGHSLGGYAAMALAAGDDAVCGRIGDPLPAVCDSIGTTLPDARIKAIVPLDGSNQMLHFSELARITVPSMGIGQGSDNVGDWQARQHAAMNGHPSYRVDVRRAVHPSFTNNCITPRVLYAKGLISLTQLNTALRGPQCSTAIDQREANRLAAQYAIAFLKTHLAGESGYQEMLTPGWALTRERDVEFFVTEPANSHALGEDPATFLFFLHQPGSQTERAMKDPATAPAVAVVDR